MQSDSVIYNERVVPKEHFRAFVYSKNNKQKLCNSYAEYEAAKKSGEWFDTFQVLEIKTPGKKPISKKKQSLTLGTYEVTNDDLVIT